MGTRCEVRYCCRLERRCGVDSDLQLAWRPQGVREFPTVNGFTDYVRLVGAFSAPRSGQKNRVLFRGTDDAGFELVPSIARLRKHRPWLTIEYLHHLETHCTDEFKQRAHLLVDSRCMPEPGGLFGPDMAVSIHWWQIMQHHGAATRLLDWTASPYVGLYFAVEKHPEKDGAVWMIDHGGAIHDRMRPIIRERGFGGQTIPLIADSQDPERSKWADILLCTPCVAPNERMIAQSGWFTCAALPETDHGVAIARAVLAKGEPGIWSQKVIISKGAKSEILRELHRMNINHATLYPGLDGFGQSLARRADLLKPADGVRYEFEQGILAAQPIGRT